MTCRNLLFANKHNDAASGILNTDRVIAACRMWGMWWYEDEQDEVEIQSVGVNLGGEGHVRMKE